VKEIKEVDMDDENNDNDWESDDDDALFKVSLNML
jgi:hypothetical protein